MSQLLDQNKYWKLRKIINRKKEEKFVCEKIEVQKFIKYQKNKIIQSTERRLTKNEKIWIEKI